MDVSVAPGAAIVEGMDDAMSTASHGSLSSEQSLDPFAGELTVYIDYQICHQLSLESIYSSTYLLL